MPRINQIQVRRDTAANWTSVNPVLAAGEIGLETNTRKTKFGDGTTAWTSLAYATSGGITSSDTAPSSPSVGDQWFNSSTGKTYVYYDGYWIELDSNGTSAQSNGNAIINGAFEIWQRGTSFAGAPGFTYTADRMMVDTASVVSRSTDVPAGIGVAYSLKHTGATATISNRIPVELNRLGATAPFDVGTTWTLSFYAKASASRDVAVSIAFRAAGPIGTAEGSVLANSVAGTMTGTWQRFTRTFTIPSVSLTSSNNLAIQISSSAGTSADFFFTGIQLEAGAVATPFRRNANSLQGELAACQRYYQQYSGIFYISNNFGTGYRSNVQFPVTMRAAPTVTATGYSGGGTQIVGEAISVGGFQTGANGPTSGPFITGYTASSEL
jgi:hypothetical protein